MRQLVRFILAIANLFEEEATAFRRGMFRLSLAIVLLLVGLAFLWGGLGLLIWALFIVLKPSTGASGAALISGGCALVLAVCIILAARKMVS